MAHAHVVWGVVCLPEPHVGSFVPVWQHRSGWNQKRGHLVEVPGPRGSVLGRHPSVSPVICSVLHRGLSPEPEPGPSQCPSASHLTLRSCHLFHLCLLAPLASTRIPKAASTQPAEILQKLEGKKKTLFFTSSFSNKRNIKVIPRVILRPHLS